MTREIDLAVFVQAIDRPVQVGRRPGNPHENSASRILGYDAALHHVKITETRADRDAKAGVVCGANLGQR